MNPFTFNFAHSHLDLSLNRFPYKLHKMVPRSLEVEMKDTDNAFKEVVSSEETTSKQVSLPN